MWRRLLKEFLAKEKLLFLPVEGVSFEPVDYETDIFALYQSLKESLTHFRLLIRENPFANPILLLAVNLARRLEKGELTFSALEQLTQFLDGQAFLARAERLHKYVGVVDPLENLASLKEFVASLPGLAEKDFDAFNQSLGRELFGLVVTAHPTFALREELLRLLADLASGRNLAGVPLNESQLREIFKNIFTKEHLSDPEITLEKEHRLALEAIFNIKKALWRFYDQLFRLAREHFPEKWWQLRPRLVTVASWVGYDLDGRRDIAWTQSFAFRLEERKLALEYYLKEAQYILDLCPIAQEAEALRACLAQIIQTVSENLSGAEEEIAVFSAASAGSEESLEALRLVAKRMYQALGRRLVRPSTLIRLIDEAAQKAQAFPEVLHRLAILRTEVENFGLGVSHIHVRLNAKQIHNAIRGLIGLETDPEDPSSKKTYLKAVDALLAGVKPVTINFGSLIAERTTAKRLFMLVTQMLKYCDAETPIRFLIAETESSFTPIAALYFAKLFNVEEKIDLSPLFETPRALFRGARIVDEMLANQFYRRYVLARGRLCIQTGFSDAGRHLGQTAASFAIENLRRRLARVVEKHRLAPLEVVIFNTHGESIGRGAHPASFKARLQYIMSPRSRAELLKTGALLKEEFSFQGGDGYVYFLNPYLALAVLTRIFEFAREPLDTDDPFYREWDYVFEFFATVQQFNERIMQDPDYALLLHEYGRNLLYPTGSRAVRRQFEVEKQLFSAAEIRAIPHNAILHQLGLLANTIGGVGQAVKKNPEQFACLEQSSPRFKLLISLAEYAFSFSDFYAFLGYLAILDPGFWLMAAAQAENPQHTQELRQVADFLELHAKYANLARVGRIFYRDILDFTAALQRATCFPGENASSYSVEDRRWLDAELRDVLEILHALRLALIYQIFSLAVQIPEFSPQRGTTREEIIERILHLDVENAVNILKNIFPLLESSPEAKDFGEKATYHTEQYLGYFQEHQNIFNPLAALYKLILRISGGITHLIGAFG